jgi:hypothetical protein
MPQIAEVTVSQPLDELSEDTMHDEQPADDTSSRFKCNIIV